MDIKNRFLNYTKINTTSNPVKVQEGVMPSSDGQMELAKLIKQELIELGLSDIKLQDNAILSATLKANTDEKIPAVAFFGHLDTSNESFNDTKAQVIDYKGGDICLNKEQDIYLKEENFKELKNYQNDEIICTDGTSLLGGDDKAAIAEIVDALQYFVKNPDIKHGDIKVGFMPDEEQGLLGAKAFDANGFADFGYTLDCCGIGEFVYENWNAGHAKVTFNGESAHPMSAKGKLKNSILMANKFISMFPAGEAPEYTEKKEGYYWVNNIQGNVTTSSIGVLIRDFYEDSYAKRKKFLQDLSDSFNKFYGEGTVEIELEDSYQNPASYLEKSGKTYPLDIVKTAYKNLDIKMKIIPMRGGHDGAAFSQNGLPCLNIFTGVHNFHSIYEYVPLKSLEAASNVIVEVVKETRKHFIK